jgi:hypothetical protein
VTWVIFSKVHFCQFYMLQRFCQNLSITDSVYMI